MPQHARLQAGLTTKQAMFDVPVPASTRTYGAIPNLDLYQFVRNKIESNGLSISNETFRTDMGGQVMLCQLHISTNDLGMDQMIAFWNSYNKTKAVRFATGSIVRVCMNGMMWTDGEIESHRHYRDNWQNIQERLEMAIDGCHHKFEQCKALRKHWKQIPINYDNTAKLAGKLYFDDIISPRMLADVKRETTESEHFAYVNADGQLRGNMWQFYNNCTEGMKRARASQYGEYHSRLTKRLASLTDFQLS